MDISDLRNELFGLYFQNKEGVVARDLVREMASISKIYEGVNARCEENVKFFNSFDQVSKIKEIYCYDKQYLVLKYRLKNYVVFDCLKIENIHEEVFLEFIQTSFFQENFGGRGDKLLFLNLDFYQGAIEELLRFYEQNRHLFLLPTRVFYPIEFLGAKTSFSILLEKSSAQLSFRADEPFLYEQLYFGSGLEPFNCQDAMKKMGLEKMREMFCRIKEIVIPIEVIPRELYEEYQQQLFSSQPKVLSRTKEKKVLL